MLNITQGTLFILYLLFLWVPTKKALLLYQQNRYQMQRYDRSLKDELCYHKEHLENICALLGVYVLLFARKEDLPCLFIMLLLMYVLVLWRKEDTTAYRKPLVYTHRVKRYLCICYVCYGLIVFYMLQIFQLYLMILLFPFFYLLPWLLLIPLGKANSKHVYEGSKTDAATASKPAYYRHYGKLWKNKCEAYSLSADCSAVLYSDDSAFL